MEYYYLDVNPEPWAVGALQLGKRNGKFFPKIGPNQQLKAAQDAIKEAIQSLPATPSLRPSGRFITLRFYFWRQMEEWLTESGRKTSSHIADATNMQKGTEDALQGILFENDRDVRDVQSVIVSQGPDITPGIGVCIEDWFGSDIPEQIASVRGLVLTQKPATSDNSWPPSGVL